MESYQPNFAFVFIFQMKSPLKDFLLNLFVRHPVLFVLLCDAVARGIIQPLTGPDQCEPALPADEGKKRAKKETPKTSRASHRDSLSPAAGQDVLKALKVHQSQQVCGNISIS